jgi:TonB-linked SusC/RagA family outer membrane protein
LDVQGKRFKKVLSIIEEQANVRFIYSPNAIDVNQKVNLKTRNEKLESVLKELLNPYSLGFTVSDNKMISLKRIASMEFKKPIAPIVLPVNQNVEVSGKVTDGKGEPLPGVSILIKGTQVGMTTDVDGNFKIEIPNENLTLVFSFVGYISREEVIGNRNSLNIALEVDEKSLEEVVVVGYGVVKKRDLTGSVSSIKSEEIHAFPTANISQALQGRIAGVHIQQNSGAPGSPMQVRIRGTNSIQGSNEPLWVIDGFPSDPSLLNPADVERMEVLKDASATAIYGSRGANGVILVTTKSGKAGKTKVDYSSSFSFQTIRKKLDMLDATEYGKLYNIFWNNTQGRDYFTESQINGFGKGTDWQDQILRNALVQDHSLNVSGGNEKTQFSIGSSYLNQQGIIKNSDFQRMVLRANINHELSPRIAVSFGTVLGRTNSNPTANDQSLIMASLAATPTVGPYKADGGYQLLNGIYPFSPDNVNNPIAYLNEVSRKQVANRVMANLGLTVKPLDGLSIKFSGNITNTDSRSDNYTTGLFPTSAGSASIGTSGDVYINSNNIVTYEKKLSANHSINAVAGMTYEMQTNKSLSASGTGFLSDATETHNIGSATTINIPSSSYSQWGLLSWLGRLNYSFKDKILATVSFRADGSSRYSSGNKWGFFPSAALAWRFIEEDIFKNIPVLSDGKIRVSYGETGSTAISPYFTLNMLSSGKVPLGTDLYTFFAPGTRFPANLKWETTAQKDIGLELGFFENRIRLTADYYIKNTRDLLNSVQLPRSFGYATTIQNIGAIENKGFELQLDGNIINKTVRWDVGLVFSQNRNTVKKLYNGQDIRGAVMSLNVANDYVNLLREGHSASSFYGYQLKGLDENGRYDYHDLNKDGAINESDKTWIGDPNPKFIYGINSTVKWKKLELNFFIQGSHGNDIFAAAMINQNYKYYLGYNTLKEVLYNHWSPENPQAKYPRLDRTFSTRMADNFVYDGSYLRLKTIRLGYSFAMSRLNKGWSSKGQIYVSGQNLLTLTTYPWWDPDVNSSGGSNSINQGIDYYSYPVPKGITVGINLSF